LRRQRFDRERGEIITVRHIRSRDVTTLTDFGRLEFMNSFRSVLTAVALATTSVCAHAQSSAPALTLVLRPGDMVRVNVWRKPELSGDFLVAADSTLKHPLYREVKVAGLTVPAARDKIVQYLTALETSPQLSIEPLFRVSVGGEVRNPSLYSLSPETSIAQAVALAGGPTERGRIDRVRLMRGGRETMLDLTQATADALSAPISSGDQILVGRASNKMRDYVLPIFGTLGGLAAIASLIINH
jgi:protein involved in polysaccharide export with SLBB domain